MALRHFILILPLALLPIAQSRAAIRTFSLDARRVMTVAVALDEPTTCVLPSAPTALEGVGVATKPGTDVAVLLSYQPGQNFFSLRALRANAKAGLNIVWQGRVYALQLVGRPEADRSVVFQTRRSKNPSATLRELIDWAKESGLGATKPSVVSDTTMRVQPHSVTRYRDFTVTLEAVFRFEPENALVFHIRLENKGNRPVTYDPDGLGVRIGRDTWTAELADASGGIPAHGTADAFFVVTAPIRSTAAFNVIVPAS